MTSIEKYDPSTPEQSRETAGTQALQNLESQAQAMGNAMKIAEAMCQTDMVPKQFRGKPADGAAAILLGAELGLNAIQSLQQVMVINGKPGIETRTAVALLKKHGYEIRTVETSDESVTVEGIGPRGEHETSTWTIDRAAQAGYTSNSLYKKIPQQMLYAKAAMEVSRKIAPHVLSGIAYSTEELKLEPVRMEAKRVDSPRGADAVRAALDAKKQKAEQETKEPQEPPINAWLVKITQAGSMQELGEIMGQVAIEFNHGETPDQGEGTPEYEQARAAANQRAGELHA